MDVKCPGCFNITTVFSHAQVSGSREYIGMMICGTVHPDTALGVLPVSELVEYIDFDRHSSCFTAILQYYPQRGRE